MERLLLPAEWEEQSMVQITWPHENTLWRRCLREITATYVELAGAISQYEPLLIVSPSPEHVKALLADSLTVSQMKNITLHKLITNDTWARDNGFITLKPAVGTDSAAGIRGRTLLDFHFNGWGEKYAYELDNAMNRRLYESGAIRGVYESNDDFVLEGGSIDSDGKGTVLTTTDCLMAPHRNQPLDKAGIEAELKRRLRADRVLWVDYGHLTGDDTDGHVDTLVRFAPGDTLLYSACDNPGDEHYDCLRKMGQQIATFRTTEGRPYNTAPLPIPEPIYEDSYRLPATYANFLVINGAVIVPTYAQPKYDQPATETIRAAFPGRDIVTIDSRVIIRQHGSIHCCTMQFPK